MTKRPAKTRLLNKAELGAKTGFADRTIDRRIAAGLLPQPLVFSAHCVRWWEHEVDAALQAVPRRSPGPQPAHPMAKARGRPMKLPQPDAP